MKPVSLAFAALALVAAGCATTESPAPAPRVDILGKRLVATAAGFAPPAPGTIAVIHYPDGRLETSRVLRTQAYAVSMLRDGQQVTEVPFCFGCAPQPESQAEADRYGALWPPEPGKSATFRWPDRDGTAQTHHVAVTGEETLDTEFGGVQTIVVEETVSGPGGNEQATRRQWFSPQLGWSVRSEWRASDGATGGGELVAIALPK